MTAPLVPPKITRAIAGALRVAIVPVQDSPGRPIILACKWCGKRSNPRGTVDAAILDLDQHLVEHDEWIRALTASYDGTQEELLAELHEVADVASSP